MIDFLIDIDTQVLLFLNSFNTMFFDSFMKTFTDKWEWAPMYATIAAVMLWRFGWKRGLVAIIATALAIGLADAVCAGVIRPLFMRMRPANELNPISGLVHIVDNYRGGRYGFPSCHAANTFALATCTALMLHSRQYLAFIYIWAAMQCYSRIYLGVHYPGDIVVGALVGFGLGYAAFAITRRFTHRHHNVFATTLPAIIVGIGTVVAILIYTIVTRG